MAAKLKKSDLQQIIDLRKQRITSAADVARMGFRPRRPFNQSLAQELIRSFEKLGPDTKKVESAAKRGQRERRRLYEKQTARAKKTLAEIKNPFRYGNEERRKAFEKLSGITWPLQQAQAQSIVLDELSLLVGRLLDY